MRCSGFLALLFVAACSPVSRLPALPADEVAAEQRRQQVAQLRDYFAQLGRLENVAFRLRVANRDACKDWAWAQIGLIADTVPGLPRRYRSFAHDALLAAEASGERRLAWRAGRLAWRALVELGRSEEGAPYRKAAGELVRAQAEATPQELREGFLARPDVAELLG